jgi:oxygen-independent coproporphyrinogen-3 oxidase
MIKFETNRTEAENELLNEVRLFFPDPETDTEIFHNALLSSNKVENVVIIDGEKYYYSEELPDGDEMKRKRYFVRICKKAVYKALEKHTGKSMPWGSLTGIRPTKLAYEFIQEGDDLYSAKRRLIEEYFVTEKKAELVCEIIKNQQNYCTKQYNFYNLYLHIPFCTSKCSYCAFITFDSNRCKKQIPRYVELLKKEVVHSQELREKLGQKVYSVYVGGGTPTAIDEESLETVLSAVKCEGREFTCEAGRPDTITREKLEIMKKHNVTRVCVNPQTFNEKTLALIGRNHTIEDFYAKYALVKEYGFDVNIDVIAGLPQEDENHFKNSLLRAIELRPDNLTVHTLSRKNGSELKNSGKYDNFYAPAMVEYAHETLGKAGYLPYYLYRQKSMLGNLENTGYTLPFKQCVNNVTTMEEFIDVDANGAGAISKKVFPDGRIERYANLRDVGLYCDQFEERLNKKRFFTENG